ncbi:MAG: ligD [Polaromonas sp.]|nr:ligD [Polaromonas sp.]
MTRAQSQGDPTAADALAQYRSKRNFGVTPEPADGGKTTAGALSYVIQKHWASRLHYDFRLEFGGTLKSWAVPKGPSLDPQVKRMAVQVEDHPISYGSFEGTIPPKQYGAGQVIVWDRGTWAPIGDAVQGFREGKLKFELHGEKLHGKWTLVRMRGDGEKQVPWLLIKEHDDDVRQQSEYDITEALPDSVLGTASVKKARAAAPAKKTPTAARPPAGVPRRALAAASSAKTVDLPPGATPSAFPPMLEPQLATLVESAPERGDWLYELKFDGYRLMARVDGQDVQCFTRHGHDWTEKMPQLAGALADLGLSSAWLDGEIVVPNSDGIPDFQLLQGAFEGRGRRVARGAPAASPHASAIVYYVFDIPFYAGHDLREVPLVERRALLQRLMQDKRFPNLRFSDAFDAPSKDLVTSACKLGFEGLIGKRADAPYQSRRSPDWIKLKCGRRQEFVICGFTEPKGSREGLGALLLGIHDEQGTLQYAGNVGSGFNERVLLELRQALDKLEVDAPPFDSRIAIPGKPHWVKPRLLAEVSFAEWTNTNRIRHAVFRGLRTDKPPQRITREKAVKPSSLDSAATAARPSPTAAGRTPPASRQKSVGAALPGSLRVTHGERVIDAESGVTKLELVQHYATVAPLMLPHIKGRPVSLVRAPAGVKGQLFFQKHAKEGELPGVNLLDPALDRDHESLLEIHSAQGLLSSAQMNTVEFHTWNAVAASIAKPDRMTFDLDPGENVAWSQMQEAALLVRTLLQELGLAAFLKTSGGKGLHVVVPLKKQHGWDTVKDFSHHIVDHLAKTLPQLFVAKSGPANRVGKIFADYLRNGFGATTASAWTARARPGMGVSVPVRWEELDTLDSGAHWTVKTIGERLDVGNTPWDDYAASARPLGAAMKALDFKAAD